MIAALPAQSADRVLVVTTDWSSVGFLSTLPTTPPWSGNNDLVPINSDAVARVRYGLIYVVNRYGADNVQVIDPNHGFQIIQEFSVGGGSNPQDIAFIAPDRAYVSCHNTNDLLIVNPEAGEILGSISLADFADEDGLCEMSRMQIEDGFLYVQIQRMFRQDWPDPWVPSPPSYLAVIDLATEELVDVDAVTPGMQGIELAGLNPVAPMQIDWNTGDLLVPEAGQYALIDAAGIERVDLQTWESKGMVITEEELGGDISDFALWSAEKAYAVVSDLAYNTKLLSFDPSGAEPPETLYNPGGYVLGDVLTHPSGYLFLADRDYYTPGVRVYDADTDALVAGPIDTGLPPFELLVLPDAVSDIEEIPLASLLGQPFPNPARDVVRLHWSGGEMCPALLEVFDLQGRLVGSRDLMQSRVDGDLEWRCLDGAGRPVASGIYMIRITTRGGAREGRVVRILR
jgi:hypothetical protein